ncbi:hypothetical protein ABFY60_01000 [Lysinibacillus pakistanensis]
MDRQRVYFSLADKMYYTNPQAGPWNFELNIDRQALDVFERIFQQMQLLEISMPGVHNYLICNIT